jgi:hypothetical protein
MVGADIATNSEPWPAFIDAEIFGKGDIPAAGLMKQIAVEQRVTGKDVAETAGFSDCRGVARQQQDDCDPGLAHGWGAD